MADLLLYDSPVSTSAQKVRLVLAEKGLEYERRVLDLQAGDQLAPDYLEVNPNGQVQALVHDGEVLIESTVIAEYLDDRFPGPSLRPATPRERARMRSWTVQTDLWLITMINNVNVGLVFRNIHRRKSPDELERFFSAIPNPLQRRRQRSLVDEGVDSPLFAIAIERYHRLLGEIDRALESGGPWLAGPTFSLADTGVLPYLNRLHDLGFEKLFARRPRLGEWFARMRARPSFAAAITDLVPPEPVAFARSCAEAEREKLDAIFAAL